MERWKLIDGFEAYEVSDQGRVRKADTGVILKSETPERITGYCKIGLANGDKRATIGVHRLVAQAFIPNPENKKHVHHINRNKADNRAENLMWVTPKEHGALDARPKVETAYYKNKAARGKMAHTGTQTCDIM